VNDRDRAFTDYVHARGAIMLRTAVHLCAGDRSAAEDLVQNTLVKTYVSWHRLRDPALRDAYVRRIMVRLWCRRESTAWRTGPRSRSSRDATSRPGLVSGSAMPSRSPAG
jgi:DNA-directed RNA polymerase specialized sigma24 family protein